MSSEVDQRNLVLAQTAVDRIEHELAMDPRLHSQHTRRGYLGDLRAFETWRGGRPMTKRLVEQYAVSLREQNRSPNTINRKLAAVRWWSRRVADLAYEEPLSKSERDEIVLQAARVATVRDVTGDREQRGRHVSPSELRALLSACQRDASPAGARDGAMFALAWNTGMRRAEITKLTYGDMKRQDDDWVLQVRGKGNKVRQAYLHFAVPWVERWLVRRGRDPGPLFCRIRKGGELVSGRRLSEYGLALILEKRGLEAALTAPIRWHDFRRTFAGNLLDDGVDLATVQRLLGHSSPTTTSNYDRRGEETRRRAVQKLDVPFWPDDE